MKTTRFIFALLCCAWLYSCATGGGDKSGTHIDRAGQTLDSLYKYYGVPGTGLLRENYPFVEDYTATYVADEPNRKAKEFAYLWPFSGTFSAVAALYESTGSDDHLKILEYTVLPGLEEYHDITRRPIGYSSYINSAPASDRYYDDNVWLGIDFTDLYRLTGAPEYLAKAEEIWRFIESGTDDVLGGGIYWCEQTKASKNTCSNAPGAVLALKLYIATGNELYLGKGMRLYEWTRVNLLDTEDNLYFDNISVDGMVDRTKYSYNSGQMIQAGVLLYRITSRESHLEEARQTAASAFDRFTPERISGDGKPYRDLMDGNVWFNAVMLRGFCELYGVDGDRKYIDQFSKGLRYAWTGNRNEKGLFSATGNPAPEKWLLNQAAVVEMLARIGGLDK